MEILEKHDIASASLQNYLLDVAQVHEKFGVRIN